MSDPIELSYFPIWRRYAELFRSTGLTDGQKGKLLSFMMDYQFEGIEPGSIPRALAFAWPYIKKDLDDARRQYETSVRNGRKGGRPKKSSAKPSPNNPDITQDNPEVTQHNPEKGKTRTMSRSRSKTMSMSNTDTGSAPASGEAGISGEKRSFGEFGWISLTPRQYADLEMKMGSQELTRCIAYVDEAAQTTGNKNRWKDWYLVLRRCHEQQWHNAHPHRDIPTGASGELGEAELDAIRRVLSEEPPGN